MLFPKEEPTYHMHLETPLDIECSDINYPNLKIFKDIVECKHKVVLGGYDNIILHNTRGFNRDHRGSDHINIQLTFHKEYCVPLPCDLKTLAAALHKIKSHKFDYNYESFFNAHRLEFSDNNLHIYLRFDHSS